jgi:Glycogen recognition site of AMP-activated protein kinase
MPAITTGFSLRLPSFISSSAPHLCIQWSSSLRLSRKPDGFEAPVFIPWRDKIAYKFIVDGRWMTNDGEPTEIDHGFVNNVYTAPPKPAPPEPEHATAPPSYRTESEAEPEHTEKVPEHADKPATNGSAVDAHHEAPVVDSTPEKASTIAEEVNAAVTPAVEATQAAAAQAALSPQEVERAADEVCLNPSLLELDSVLTRAIQLVPEPQAPKEPVLSASEVGFIPSPTSP